MIDKVDAHRGALTRGAIANARVAPRNPDHEELAWMREVVSEPFDGARAERLVADLRAQGRPVYLSPMGGFQVPYMARMVAVFTQLGAQRVPLGEGDVVLRLPPAPAPG